MSCEGKTGKEARRRGEEERRQGVSLTPFGPWKCVYSLPPPPPQHVPHKMAAGLSTGNTHTHTVTYGVLAFDSERSRVRVSLESGTSAEVVCSVGPLSRFTENFLKMSLVAKQLKPTLAVTEPPRWS